MEFQMESKMINNRYLKNIILAFCISFFFTCEEEFIPEINSSPPEIVVEGFIEGGDNQTSPYVILTRSVPFFNEINLNDVNGFFVRDAEITVSTDDRTIRLEEFCLSELTFEQRLIVSDLFGINADTMGLDFCVYIDPTFSLEGEEGKRYDLHIEVEDKVLTASTVIPQRAKISDLEFVDLPGIPVDTLRELRITLEDRPNEANFYRYFTSENEEGVLAPLNSVLNDLFFDGDKFEFPLPKAEASDVEFDFETYGFYTVGDTMEVKFCSIDEAHYDFWSTLEFNRANQGPFSSYTAISYNIEGGIGIWGGYASSIRRLVVE